MRRPRTLLALWPLSSLVLFASLSACRGGAPAAQPATAEARLARSVEWLAADEQEGRRAGTPAGLRAGEWLAARLKELGLEPGGSGGYLQTFEVPKPVEVGPGSSVDGVSDPAQLTPVFCAIGGEVSGAIAWRGYGIVNAEKSWNDYRERADGKVVLIVRGTPPAPSEPAAAPTTGEHGGNVQSGDGWGNSGSLFLKVMNAKRNGAAAVLIAPHPSQQAEPLPFFDHSRASQSILPALFVSHALAARLVPGYDAAIQACDRGAPLPELSAAATVRVKVDVTRERGPATNVLALLRGKTSERCVVIGAHYDHLGHGGEGSLDPNGREQIHNGADDNASGTAVVLEVARALAAGPKPDCDVLFALWSGEELGLLGSEHWAQNPTVELARVRANVNLDMVGRAGSGKLAVLGAGSAAPLAAWLAELGPQAGLQLDVNLSGQGVGGSDHQSFLKRKIPAVHFFSGLHPDYHKPSDDAERFEREGAARVAVLAEALTRRIAAAEALAFVEPPAAPAQPGQARAGGFRVWFGTVPEYSYSGKGLLLSGTSAGSPAEKAGMLAGDILVQVGDVEIESIQDFMYALQTYKPGDVVVARFIRDGREESTRVTLATRDAQ